MKLKDKEGWQKSVDANKDGGYGEAVIRYCERWANAMEAAMARGATLPDVAEQTSHDADGEGPDGITGFQYGCAVSILAQVWEHGEELRRWHNLDS